MKRFYDAYLEHFKVPAQSILEIGSRDGRDAEKLRLLSDIDAKNVFVVEPHPFSYRRIISNFPDFRVFEFAIFDKVGVLDFNAIPPPPEGRELDERYLGFMGTSSLLKKNKATYFRIANMTEEIWAASNPNTWIKVLCIDGKTLLQLIDKPEIDLVKIDVEGATFNVLKSFGDDLRLLKALHLELEAIPVWENEITAEESHKLLTYYGFKEAYWHPQYFGNNQGDSIWLRND
jgi:FkbM family methyltransferase